MSESNKPTEPTEKQSKTPQTDQPLPEAALEKVSGGLGPIIFTKHYDKSSPYMG